MIKQTNNNNNNKNQKIQRMRGDGEEIATLVHC
jgi:hypothetical protein